MENRSHVTCVKCFLKLNPVLGRVSGIQEEEAKCCFCGAKTYAWVRVWSAPERIPCQGRHVSQQQL
jgi:hypothetical protein